MTHLSPKATAAQAELWDALRAHGDASHADRNGAPAMRLRDACVACGMRPGSVDDHAGWACDHLFAADLILTDMRVAA